MTALANNELMTKSAATDRCSAQASEYVPANHGVSFLSFPSAVPFYIEVHRGLKDCVAATFWNRITKRACSDGKIPKQFKTRPVGPKIGEGAQEQ